MGLKGSAGAIVGIVFGCLIGLSVSVTIIVCVCCRINSRQLTKGQVITSSLATIAYACSNNTAYLQPTYPQNDGFSSHGFIQPQAYNAENTNQPPLYENVATKNR
ncbi:Hypothetical predicted protein [Mytilus galloprovincialis]|uniref:Cysteine and tyrosine-rich protein 1 n=1 Tax=Mytilus galloprovincialis TaxID=29158 RepID=A0A8B6GY05_MYTGA|nr:Hypothetical predicted protein [Mytilus galloprovincialis]